MSTNTVWTQLVGPLDKAEVQENETVLSNNALKFSLNRISVQRVS